MADTKQATPDWIQRHTIEGIQERLESMYAYTEDSMRMDCDHVMRIEALGHMLRGEIARLASRSGPDRTTREDKVKTLSGEKVCVLCSGPIFMGQTYTTGRNVFVHADHDICKRNIEAGPDRGQQDAPDEERFERHARAIERGGKFSFVRFVDGQYQDYRVRDLYGLWKSAREGQAPKGDRIKVEREPGCKCEYAIWTNARGCPVHDDPSLLRY